MNALMTNTSGFPGVAVEVDANNFFAAGTGTNVPSAADTALQTEITTGGRASTTVTVAQYQTGTPDYCQITRRATFSTSQANGTIGEFGWLSASTAGSLRARSVPKDTSGTQTTIIKNSSSTLVVDWSIYSIYLQGDTLASRTIGGTTYALTLRAIGANASTPASYFIISRGPLWSTGFAHGARTQSALAARTASCTTGTGLTSSSVDAYVNGSYTRAQTLTTQAAAAIAFLTNCGGTNSDQYCCMQIGFSPNVVSGQPLKVKISLTPV
jgi:hypothetical protein